MTIDCRAIAVAVAVLGFVGPMRGEPPSPIAPARVAGPSRDYGFDRTMSRQVLENYLSRSISMEGILNGRGDLDDNIRMLKSTGAARHFQLLNRDH